MTIYSYIVLIGCCLLLLTIILISIKAEKTDKIAVVCGIIGCVFFVVGGTGHIINSIPTTPSAIDVYRGKTTLEITYRDSVAIDSTVVYKVK